MACFALFLLLFASNSFPARKVEQPSDGWPSMTLEDSDSNPMELESRTIVIIRWNSTIFSKKHTFELGFLSPGDKSKSYLGIRYASVPTPTYVWIANREKPITNLSSCTLEISEQGKLVILESKNSVIWQSTNTEKATNFMFDDTGNLVLLSKTGSVVWQSFDQPTDTWLPSMNMTSFRPLTSWRSLSDPSPGLYSLRLNTQDFQFELVYNRSIVYWQSGNWTGDGFVEVPEMTMQDIYDFKFDDPFTSMASFWYNEPVSKDDDLVQSLTRFQMGINGQLRLYTWSQQTKNWDSFWSQPESQCGVYGLCGDFSVCKNSISEPCVCLPGFWPVSDYDWKVGNYSGGCITGDGHKEKAPSKFWDSIRIAAILGSGGSMIMLAVIVWYVRRSKASEDDEIPLVVGLKVFSYEEIRTTTGNFSRKLGHGGFGVVYQGELLDSTLVAVKCLQKPGSGEKQFRAEVSTLGNIQHVNLVRLIGFCSEGLHRILVYEYIPNGHLGMYLHQSGPNLSWEVRFGIAVGTARAIAYLHEECRESIIHCDIKPENILLDADYNAKVADFGLAKLIDNQFSRVLTNIRGTRGYFAPEWLSGIAVTTKVDVYSYGMTLLELLRGRRNVESGREEMWFYPPYAAQEILKGNVAAVMDNRLGSAYNIEEAKRAALVAIWCIQDREDIRPTMGMVVKMLNGLVEVNNPPLPKRLLALISSDFQ